MPTIAIKRDSLFEALGKTYSDEEFENLCFQFGLELDEVTTEKQITTREQGSDRGADASEDVVYKIDVPANRYDLLCLEGLVTGLLVFLNESVIPRYELVSPEGTAVLQTVRMTSECLKIRGHIVAAVLRGVTLTRESYDSFIDLQDKLHRNIGRKRTLVSVGTHDLDTIQGPFVYDARPPTDIRFVPLDQRKEYTGLEIMSLYANHAQLKQYLPIVRDSPVYPVVLDSNGVVLSLPPIVNGDRSRITLDTKNIFIECTATDLTKARIVLDTIVCAFSRYCSERYTVEPVRVVYPDGTVFLCPDLKYRVETIDLATAIDYIGVEQTAKDVARLLSRMSLRTSIKDDDDGKLEVEIPPTRHDVIHPCDIYEDIAIAYGYNDVPRAIPDLSTIAEEFPLNKLSDQLRVELAQAGFTEALTFSLCSREDVSEKLGVKIEDVPAVHVSNPKTLEFQVARTTLLPGLLKTLASNKKMPLPLKLFEVSDVVVRCDEDDEDGSGGKVGARNDRRLCAVYSNKSAGFEVIHGLLDRVMRLLEVPWIVKPNDTTTTAAAAAAAAAATTAAAAGYYLRAVDDPAFFPQRCAEIVCYGRVVGKIGVLHPNVISRFELNLPCSAVEITIEPFL